MTTETAALLALIVLGYLLGSIPFGLFVAKSKGIDPRTEGSGNIGATNVGRLLGRKYFWYVMLLDALKSFVPTALGSLVVHYIHPTDRPVTWDIYMLWVGAGVAAVLGHMFSLFMKFKGGKGVASSAGVIVGLIPYFTVPAVVSISTFAIVFQISRYVSLASILAVTMFPIAYIAMGLLRGWDVFGQQIPLLFFAIGIPSLIVFRHRTNIKRLLAGTENKSPRKKADVVSSPASAE